MAGPLEACFPLGQLRRVVTGAQADGGGVAVWFGQAPCPGHPGRCLEGSRSPKGREHLKVPVWPLGSSPHDSPQPGFPGGASAVGMETGRMHGEHRLGSELSGSCLPLLLLPPLLLHLSLLLQRLCSP